MTKIRYLSCADRGVQQLHPMQNGHRFANRVQAGLKLKRTTRITGNHDIGAGVQDIFRLAIAQLPGGARLQHVVDSRRSAADCRVVDFQQFKAGDGQSNALGCECTRWACCK